MPTPTVPAAVPAVTMRQLFEQRSGLPLTVRLAALGADVESDDVDAKSVAALRESSIVLILRQSGAA